MIVQPRIIGVRLSGCPTSTRLLGRSGAGPLHDGEHANEDFCLGLCVTAGTRGRCRQNRRSPMYRPGREDRS